MSDTTSLLLSLLLSNIGRTFCLLRNLVFVDTMYAYFKQQLQQLRIERDNAYRTNLTLRIQTEDGQFSILYLYTYRTECRVNHNTSYRMVRRHILLEMSRRIVYKLLTKLHDGKYRLT